MTPNFDKFISSIITEGGGGRCKGLTLTQLSNKAGYRFMKCVENPYSFGFKRVYFGDKRGRFDRRKCKKPQRPGTQGYEECLLLKKAAIQRLKMRLKQRLLRRLNK